MNPTDLLAFSPARVGAMVTRYSYLLRSSWPRVLDLLYWPTVQLVTWGFIQRYLGSAATAGGTAGHLAIGAGTLIGAVMLWDVLFRGQLGFSLSFLEEMHSRNIGNLFMSPLRPLEFVASLIVMSVVRLTIGIVPVTGLAVWFFGFNLWTLGLALAAFFANLMLTSWSVGLIVSGFLLRNGLGAEELAWSFMFLLLPLCCVYYPVGVLPAWLQAVSLVVAAHLCVRRVARGAERSRFPRRPHGAGSRHQCGAVRRSARSCSSGSFASPASWDRCCKWGSDPKRRSGRCRVRRQPLCLLRFCRTTGRESRGVTRRGESIRSVQQGR